MKYDFFLSYAAKDTNIADEIYQYLTANGLNIWYAHKAMLPASSFAEPITEAIRNSDGMIVLISQNSVSSQWVWNEVNLAYEDAAERNKKIIPIKVGNITGEYYYKFKFYLGRYQWIELDTSKPDYLESACSYITNLISENKRKSDLYEEISELKRIGLFLEASRKMTEITEIVISQIKTYLSVLEQYKLILELSKCLEQLHLFYDHVWRDYSKEARQVTACKLNMLSKLNLLLETLNINGNEIFSVC